MKAHNSNRGLKLPFFYGWVITALGFVALVASMGIRTSFGSFVAPWEIEFDLSRSDVSLISALSMVFYGLFMPVAGSMADKYGARLVFTVSIFLMGVSFILLYFSDRVWLLYVLYGIVASIGFAGASNVTASAAVVQWFDEKRGLVLSFMVAGMATGQMLLVPLSIYMINAYDWRWTMLVYGATYLLLLTPAFLYFFKNRPEDIGVQPYGFKSVLERGSASAHSGLPLNTSVLNIFRLPVTWLLILTYFICGMTDIGLVHTHLIPLAEGRMISSSFIAIVMSTYALVNLILTPFVGYLTDRINLTRLLAALFMIRAVSIGILIFAEDPAMFIIYGIVGGLTDFTSIAPVAALCARWYGPARVGTVFGFMSLFHQFGAAAGSYFPGVIFDMTGGYNLALMICTTLLVAASVIIYGIKGYQPQISTK